MNEEEYNEYDDECTCTIGIHGWWGCPVHHRKNPEGSPPRGE